MRSPIAATLTLAAPLALLAAGCSAGPGDAETGQPETVEVEETTEAAGGSEAAPTEGAAKTPETDQDAAEADMTDTPAAPEPDAPTTEVATLGAGCYWCIEAVLEQIDGVESVVSGFMGGEVEDPTYREVCAGTTGHAEVVQVTFDPTVITYEELLDWFWRLHDPTTLNRQGADVGTQYRSAIFTHSDAQAETARKSLEAAQPSFEDPIVTEITPASTFYVAPEYHQGYYQENRQAGYCRVVIKPKLKKLGLKD